jgi:hypothetical protein
MSYEDDNVWAGVYGNKPSWQHPSGSNARLGAMIREGNERRAKEQKAREEASRRARMYAPVEPAPPPQTYYPDNVSSISYPSSVSTSVRSSATSPTAYEVPPPSYSLPYSRWPDAFRPEWWSECTDFEDEGMGKEDSRKHKRAFKTRDVCRDWCTGHRRSQRCQW